VSACPVCEGPATFAASVPDATGVSGRTFAIFRCSNCSLGFVEPELSDEDLARYYPDTFYGGRASSTQVALAVFMAARARIVTRARPRLRTLLDVGCGAGDFLDAMRARGVQVVGMEPSAGGRERARARGMEVHASIAMLPPGEFDVITLWHVAEHVRDVVRVLAACRQKLAPGGRMVVAVPNAESWEAQVFGQRWFHLDVPRHQLQFSSRALGEALGRAGLVVDHRAKFSLETDPFGMLQSALNCLPIEHNALYQVAKHDRPIGSLALLDRLAVSAAPLFAPLAAIAELGLSRAGLNGTLCVVARPVDEKIQSG